MTRMEFTHLLVMAALASTATRVVHSSKSKGQRIVGGDIVVPHSKPFTVVLASWNPGEPFKIGLCGGSILDEWTILTAGHCINSKPWVMVLAGRHNVMANEIGAQQVISRSFTLHPGFLNASSVSRDDIGLVHLPHPLQWTKWVQPVVMGAEEPLVGASVEALGWGKTESNSSSYWLRSVTNQVISDQLASQDHVDVDTHKFICTDTLNGRGTCTGDSGGPLLNELNELVGVTSFGDHNCLSGRAQCFASVEHYKHWILQHMRKTNNPNYP